MLAGAEGSSVARAAIAMFATDVGRAATPSGNGGLVLGASLITQDF